MLRCLPQGLCSWDFRITGGASGLAEISFNFFSSQGRILFEDATYALRRASWIVGPWALERDGQVYANARRMTFSFGSFEINWGQARLIVSRRAPFTRGYNLLLDGVIVGAIQPDHALTRRATIECNPIVPELVQLFAFALVALTWRQKSRNRQ